MKIRRFEAENRQEAMKQVKAVLGPEALILSSRSIRNPSQPQQSIFEIVAATDSEPTPEFPKPTPRAPFPNQRGYAAERTAATPPNRIVEKLLACGLSPDWVSPLIREFSTFSEKENRPEGEKIQDYLVRRLAEGVAVADAQWTGGRVWALVGPTGVGKTTTIAKLAAYFSLKLARKVLLVTIDTYRIGAVEQLATYARILGLPLKVAASPRELKSCLEEREEQDLVLIDTAGRSPKNTGLLDELQDFLTISPIIGSHLVVSATTKEGDLKRVITGFGRLPLEGYICTKLDETDEYLPLFNQLVPTRRPLSYFTHGQRVPEDLEQVTKARIARLLSNQIHWN
jgi:flagellar biosynthesis protein FlhF